MSDWLEPWIGETVEVAFNHYTGTVSGELLEVNEAGILLLQTAQHKAGSLREAGTESAVTSTHHTFYPWPALMYVMRTVYAEETADEG